MISRNRKNEDLAAIRQAALDAEPYANPGPEERRILRQTQIEDSRDSADYERKMQKHRFLSSIIKPVSER